MSGADAGWNTSDVSGACAAASSGWEPIGDTADTADSWGASGSWEQGHRLSPWEGDRRREPRVVPGIGYKPRANDPNGWLHGENRPSTEELEEMLSWGKEARKPIRNKFKSYTQLEGTEMAVEDQLSGLIAVAERDKAARDAAATLHAAELAPSGCLAEGARHGARALK
jgi:hypothetical protein